MKIIISFLLIAICLSFGGSQSSELDVYVTQRGKVVQMRNQAVKLSKRTFELNFPFRKTTSFLVSCSFNDSTINAAKAGLPIEELIGFSQTGMAEGRFNDNRDVIVSDFAPSYWYYNGNQDSRFDSIIPIDKKSSVGIRTIEQIYDVKTRQTRSLKDIKEPLYFVFIAYTYDQRLSKRVETSRNWLTLNF